MIAPRAVLMIESSQIPRMGAEAARVDALAARELWKALGVPDRMGATEERVGHCQWHPGFTPAATLARDFLVLRFLPLWDRPGNRWPALRVSFIIPSYKPMRNALRSAALTPLSPQNLANNARKL